MKVLVPLLVCLSAVMQATQGQTILDIVKSEGLKTLATALEKANLTEIFSQRGSLTLFAPSDEAFAKLPPGALDSLLADPQELKDTLSYHGVQGAITSNLIVNNMHAETLLPNEQIILDFENGVLRINRQIRVIKTDVEATNGVVHVIDSVLIPMRTRPTSIGGPSSGGPGLMDLVIKNELNSVMAMAQQSGLFHQLNSDGPYTLLAPNDQAMFASGDMASLGRIVTDPKLVANLLKFHVIPGVVKSSDIKDGQSVQTLNGLNIVFKKDTQGDIFVNDAKVLSPNIEANNGVMHIIDTILEPENMLNPSEAPSSVSPSATKQGLMDVVAENNLPSLMVMAQQSGLFHQLNSEGPYTLLAPKEDNNFGGMDPAKIGEIMSDPQKMGHLLKFHVIPGIVKSSDIKDGQTVTTLNGQDLMFSVNAEGVSVNGVKVLNPDIIAGNGVIHVIDNILVPETEGSEGETPGSVAPFLTKGLMDALVENNLPSLMVLAQQSGLFHQLNTEGPYTLLAPKEDNNFGGMDPAKIGEIMSDPQKMGHLLKFHVIPGIVKSSDIKDGQTVTTLNGQDLVFSVNAEGVSVNGVKVLNPDIIAGNGVIHVIDNILVPETEGSEGETPGSVPPFLTKGLMDALVENNLPSLMVLAQQSGLFHQLNTEGPYTLLAPKEDNNFGGMDPSKIGEIMSDPKAIAHLLKFHVIPGIVKSSDIKDGQTITTLNGQNIVFSVNAEGVSVNGVKILNPDIAAGNGVIHVIDNILVPKTEGSSLNDLMDTLIANKFDNFALLLKAADLTDALVRGGPYAVFAPTDAAMEAWKSRDEILPFMRNKTQLADLLKYHVSEPINGYNFSQDLTFGTLLGDDHKLRSNVYRRESKGDAVFSFMTIDGVPISRLDIKASNGVIHVIDGVLTPPTQNVSDIIAEEANLQTLSSAVKTAGLETLLSSKGNFTFFAPTDAAFDKLPSDELANLLKDKTKLEALLKNHILPTVVYKSGHQVNIEQSLGFNDLFMNAAIDEVIPAFVTNYEVKANIKQFDLKAVNGVVHKIDTVIQ